MDADGDGVRNPQDIDDAALGTAVYLCSGSDDLGTDAGRRGAVYRYNHSQSYVDLVLDIMDAYLQGDFTSIPNGTVMAGELTKTPPPLHVPGTPAHRTRTSPSRRTTRPTTPSTRPPTDGGGSTDDDATDGGSTADRRRRHRRWRRRRRRRWRRHPRAGHPVSVPPLPTTSVPPVDQTLTLAQATVQCTLDGLNQLLQPQAFQACLNNYMNP